MRRSAGCGRHFSNGQAPLRSRSHPLGLSDLSAVDFAKLKQSNLDIEVAGWFAAQALECTHWLFPEDSGGHATEGTLFHLGSPEHTPIGTAPILLLNYRIRSWSELQLICYRSYLAIYDASTTALERPAE